MWVSPSGDSVYEKIKEKRAWFVLLALPLAGGLSCHCGVPLLMLELQRLKTTALQESPRPSDQDWAFGDI